MRVTSDRVAGGVTLSHRLEARNNRTQLAQDGGAARFCLFATVFNRRWVTTIVLVRERHGERSVPGTHTSRVYVARLLYNYPTPGITLDYRRE